MATKKKMPARGSKRVRRFDKGGSTDPYAGMSQEQKDWLGNADPTDPYILYRMRNAVPDTTEAPKAQQEPFESGFTPTEDLNPKASAKPVSVTKTQTRVTTPVNTRTTDANRYKDLTDQNDRRLKQVQVSYEDQNDRRLKQAKPVTSSTDNNKLSMEDMKKSIGFDSSNASDLMPGGAALRSLRNLSSNIIKNKAVKKAEEEAMSGGFSYADKLAREAKRPPDLIDYLVGKKAEARDYILNKLPRNSVANKTRKFEESGAMPGEFNASEMRPGFKKGGKVKAFKQGGSVKSEPTRSSASKRADGCAIKGHTRGKYN
jgi:hypothetical protein